MQPPRIMMRINTTEEHNTAFRVSIHNNSTSVLHCKSPCLILQEQKFGTSLILNGTSNLAQLRLSKMAERAKNSDDVETYSDSDPELDEDEEAELASVLSGYSDGTFSVSCPTLSTIDGSFQSMHGNCLISDTSSLDLSLGIEPQRPRRRGLLSNQLPDNPSIGSASFQMNYQLDGLLNGLNGRDASRLDSHEAVVMETERKLSRMLNYIEAQSRTPIPEQSTPLNSTEMSSPVAPNNTPVSNNTNSATPLVPNTDNDSQQCTTSTAQRFTSRAIIPTTHISGSHAESASKVPNSTSSHTPKVHNTDSKGKSQSFHDSASAPLALSEKSDSTLNSCDADSKNHYEESGSALYTHVTDSKNSSQSSANGSTLPGRSSSFLDDSSCVINLDDYKLPAKHDSNTENNASDQHKNRRKSKSSSGSNLPVYKVIEKKLKKE